MPYYRLYFLNREDHIRNVIDMECVDDAAAILTVGTHADSGRVMELWNQDRLVQRFEANADEGEAGETVAA